jgi:hypothetical protein
MAQPDRHAQMPQGDIRAFELQGRHAERTLSYGPRRESMVPEGLAGHGPGQNSRLGRVRFGKPKSLAGLLFQARAHNQF